MKRIMAFILVFGLCLSFCACGGKSSELPSELPSEEYVANTTQTATEATKKRELTYEELISSAQEIEFSDILSDVDENKLRAQETYVGNAYRVALCVAEIENDHFSSNHLGYGILNAQVYPCNYQDLLTLTKNNTYEIVGIITDVSNDVVFENAYIVDFQGYRFELDGAYYSLTGSIDPSRYGLTVEEFLERNPQMKEDNLSDEDNIDLFVFATLHSLEEGKADLYLPETDYGELVGESLPLKLSFDGNSFDTNYEVNDYENRMSQFFKGYKDGKYFNSDFILQAGSDDKISIVGLFFIKYGDYKKAIENNSVMTLDWGGKYTLQFNAGQIEKEGSLATISENLKVKGLLE